jgi:hypothetical protein
VLRPRLTYANVAATLALVLAAGGFAFAANPGDDGVIRGCLKTGSKVIRVPDSAKCRKTEKKLAWNQTGPKGDEGSPGMSGYQIVDGDPGAPSGPNFTAGSTATCPKGKKAVGGGFNASGNASGVRPVHSKPFGENQWIVQTASDAGDYELTAYAVCVVAAE